VAKIRAASGREISANLDETCVLGRGVSVFLLRGSCTAVAMAAVPLHREVALQELERVGALPPTRPWPQHVTRPGNNLPTANAHYLPDSVLCSAMLRYVMLRYAMPPYATLCRGTARGMPAMLCYAILCYSTLCYAQLCRGTAHATLAMLRVLCHATLHYAGEPLGGIAGEPPGLSHIARFLLC